MTRSIFYEGRIYEGIVEGGSELMQNEKDEIVLNGFLDMLVSYPLVKKYEPLVNFQDMTGRYFIYDNVAVAVPLPEFPDQINYGDYVQMDDRFETCHVWSRELEELNVGRWIPQKISYGKYEEYLNKNKPVPDQKAAEKAKDKRVEIADFIYQSMCIDGFVKFDSFVDEIVRHGEKLNGMLFEVTDKKRGKFFIAWFK